jgi:hypothetical protein
MGQIATMKQAERIINAFGPDLFKALKLDDGPWHIIAQNIGSDEMNHFRSKSAEMIGLYQ